jgi:hypothetical protein
MKVERTQLSLASASRQFAQTTGSRRVGASADLSQREAEDKPDRRHTDADDAEANAAAHAGAGKNSEGRLLNITA